MVSFNLRGPAICANCADTVAGQAVQRDHIAGDPANPATHDWL